MSKQLQIDPVIPVIRVSREIKDAVSKVAKETKLSESRIVREILEAVLLNKAVKIKFRSPIVISEESK